MSTLPRFDLPKYKATLPTSNTVVTFRPLIQKDEKILLIAKESKDPSDILEAIKQVVSNCVLDGLNDLESLPIIDLEFLFIRLRAASVGNISKVSYIDGEDQQTRDFDVDLDKVTVTNAKPWETIVINENCSIELRYPPASLYADKTFLHATGVDVVEGLIQSTIKTIINKGTHIEADKVSKEELQEFLESLPVPEYTKIADCIGSLPHLSYTIEYKNSKGTDRKIELSSLNDFFTFA